MPFAMMLVGVLLVLTAIKDTYAQLGAQVQKDFTGPNNFFVWILAFMLIGSFGYVEKLKGFSNAFMALLLLAMFLSNSKRGDVITSLREGLMSPVAPAKPQASAGAATGTSESMTGSDLTKPMSALTSEGITAAFSKFTQPSAASGSMGGLFGGSSGGDNPMSGIMSMFGGFGGGASGSPNPMDLLGGSTTPSASGNDWTKGVALAAKMLFMFI